MFDQFLAVVKCSGFIFRDMGAYVYAEGLIDIKIIYNNNNGNL